MDGIETRNRGTHVLKNLHNFQNTVDLISDYNRLVAPLKSPLSLNRLISFHLYQLSNLFLIAAFKTIDFLANNFHKTFDQ